jgi:hypothetical protein
MALYARIRRIAVAAALGATLGASSVAVVADDMSHRDALALLAAWLVDGKASVEQGVAALEPAMRAAAAPAVAALIARSRDDAVARGVEPIPARIRREIDDYVPSDVLDAVRWCAACGGEFSLQKGTFRLGLAPAITLDHVIVFAERDAALTDPALWIHELRHVMQFRDWGVDGFAARYVEDYEAVEREAADFRWEWVQRTGWLERRKDWGR